MSDRANAQIQVKILTPPAVWSWQQQPQNQPPGGNGFVPTMPSSLQTLQEKETQDAAGRSALYVNPAAIPAGIGLSIGVDVASPSSFQFGVDLAVTSPQCTGS
jgi:hypothetical protein